ncbi:hypothetical protein [Brachyspira pilosicoli]|uniref:hypothetical protein n=1 Tax=Brachyspira pilosicoli TaxID=52584 RepID=UPI0012F52418|nr:hypothetical protein [Brachyspira pilosicoli]
MKKLLLFAFMGLLFLSCASIKTYRDDLKGSTRYYTDDSVEWGAFLNIIVYDNEVNNTIFALKVRTQALPDYINLKEIYFFDQNTKKNISFLLDDSKNDMVYISGYYTGYAYVPSQTFKIAEGTKIMNIKEINSLYDFMTNSKKPYIRFYGDFQIDNYLPSGQQKNIIKLIEKYRNGLK